MNETRDRILDVALDVLGEDPDAGMGDIASAAGVVRRTVYGHVPNRTDLVRSLTQRAVNEVAAVARRSNQLASAQHRCRLFSVRAVAKSSIVTLSHGPVRGSARRAADLDG